MIPEYSVSTGRDHVELKWTNPKLLPESYQVKYMCGVKATSTPSLGMKIYLVKNIQSLNPDTNSVRLSHLRQGSTCVLILIAVYNPASIDAGITIAGITSKYNFIIIYKCFR